MADVVTYFHQYNPTLNNERILQMASQEITKKLGGIDLMEAYDFTIKGTLKRGRQEGMQIGEKKGLQKGMQQGMQQGLQEVTLKLLEMGMSIEKVSQVTGFSKVKIRKLQAEAKK